MGFNIMDLMNGATRAAVEGVDNYEAITLNLDEIKVTKHNRYSMDDLEELATSIPVSYTHLTLPTNREV